MAEFLIVARMVATAKYATITIRAYGAGRATAIRQVTPRPIPVLRGLKERAKRERWNNF